MAANPMWVAGMKPTNPKGRNAGSQTARGRLEHFLKRRYTTKELNKILDGLTATGKADFYIQALSYILAKPQPDSLSRQESDELFEKLAAMKERLSKYEGNGTTKTG